MSSLQPLANGLETSYESCGEFLTELKLEHDGGNTESERLKACLYKIIYQIVRFIPEFQFNQLAPCMSLYTLTCPTADFISIDSQAGDGFGTFWPWMAWGVSTGVYIFGWMVPMVKMTLKSG